MTAVHWTRAWDHWRRYWLAPGGVCSIAAIRIAIALSLLWMLWRFHPITGEPPSASYYRIGIWLLYPGRPDPGLLSALEAIAWCSTAALLVGAGTRIAHPISLVSVLALATYRVSDTPTWSHPDVPPLLASIALLGAHGGAALSVDAWWQRRRGRPAPDGAAHQASVRAGPGRRRRGVLRRRLPRLPPAGRSLPRWPAIRSTSWRSRPVAPDRGWSRAGPTAVTDGVPALPRRTMPRGAPARRVHHSQECPAVRAMS